MKIVSFEQVDMSLYGKKSACDVYRIHVKVVNIDIRAEEMIKTIRDTSWLDPLGVVEQVTFSARSRRSIERLVRQILDREDDEVTSEFGEYLVSDTAQSVLAGHYNHVKVPLAELLKEKVSGNPGFDFHTESHVNFIAFGEAKYSGVSSPYQDALEQIGGFIELEKDSAELSILQNFVSHIAVENFINGHKSYVAAFSVNAKKPDSIIANALKSDFMDALLVHRELYIIGVEIDA